MVLIILSDHMLAVDDFYCQPKRHQGPGEVKDRLAEYSECSGWQTALNVLLEDEVTDITAASIS